MPITVRLDSASRSQSPRQPTNRSFFSSQLPPPSTVCTRGGASGDNACPRAAACCKRSSDCRRSAATAERRKILHQRSQGQAGVGQHSPGRATSCLGQLRRGRVPLGHDRQFDAIEAQVGDQADGILDLFGLHPVVADAERHPLALGGESSALAAARAAQEKPPDSSPQNERRVSEDIMALPMPATARIRDDFSLPPAGESRGRRRPHGRETCGH